MQYKPRETSHTYWSENSTCLSLISPQAFYSLRLNESFIGRIPCLLLSHDCCEVTGFNWVHHSCCYHTFDFMLNCVAIPPIGPPSILVLFGSQFQKEPFGLDYKKLKKK